MKVDGSMAEMSQKIAGEGAGSRFCFIQNGRTGGFACGPWPAPVQKHSKLCGTRSDGAIGVLKQKVILEIPA
jgi:hypothetical protein